MTVSLPPRTYLAVDRGSKLVGLVAIAAGLQHLFGSFSVLIAVLGLLLGVATVFVDVRDDNT